jgi:oxygen-independent coproporphyrinogen-3 oxidase
VAERFGSQKAAELREKSDRYIKSGKMMALSGFLKLTPEGKLLADGIAADLFFE